MRKSYILYHNPPKRDKTLICDSQLSLQCNKCCGVCSPYFLQICSKCLEISILLCIRVNFIILTYSQFFWYLLSYWSFPTYTVWVLIYRHYDFLALTFVPVWNSGDVSHCNIILKLCWLNDSNLHLLYCVNAILQPRTLDPAIEESN